MKHYKSTFLLYLNFRARTLQAALFLVFLACFCTVANAASTSPFKFTFSGSEGLSVSYQGIPLIRKSTLDVIKPGWSGELYNQRKNPRDVQNQLNIQTSDDGSWHISGGNTNWSESYTLQLLDPQTFEMHFSGKLLQDIPAQIEFNVGRFNANLFANRGYHATLRSGETVSGVVPSFPAQEGLIDLVPGFQTLEFDSRLGKMTISLQSEKPMVFSDARNYQTALGEESPIFWCGWLAGTQPLAVNHPLDVTLRIHIDPSSTPATPMREEASFHPAVNDIPNALVTVERPTQVVPQPKKMQMDEKKYFPLQDAIQWAVTAPPGETRLAPAVEQLLGAEWHLQLAPPSRNKSTFKSWCGIRIGSNAPISFPTSLVNTEWANHGDSYQLKVDEKGILILAPTARGAFYGVQTLAQLLYFENKMAAVPFVEIEDWPTLQFRGALFHPSQAGVSFDKKLIEVMARYKFNYACIACEFVRWDTHPEITSPQFISKKDLQDLVNLCRANFIEPFPEIDGPGHATWMFGNKQHQDLQEDPTTPYAFSVNNPKSWDVLHDVMAEVIAIFHPKIFHIGMDEVTSIGQFPGPGNPLNPRDVTYGTLLLKYLNSQHDWLAKQGIKTMIWGDMFVNYLEGGVPDAHAQTVEQAQLLRGAIPKDVIVADWHYNDSKTYPSLGLFQAEGLTTIACPWYKPKNIRSFTQAAISSNAWGILQTTWGPGFLDEKILKTWMREYSAFILAADYSWSGRNELPDRLPYDAIARWNRAYSPSFSSDQAMQSGVTLNLDAAANVGASNWLGFGKGWDLADFFKEQNTSSTRRLGKIDFYIPDHRFVALSNAPAQMAPEGALSKLTLEINQTASEIAFLHTTLWDVPTGVTVARCDVEYADGSSSEIKFTTEANIAPWLGHLAGGNAMSVWKGTSPAGTPLKLCMLRWENPHPEKAIARLVLEPVDAQGGYALAAITLLR